MVIVDPNVFAKTERLLLRPLKLDDAEDVVLMRKDPEVMKHTPLLPNDDLESTEEWIRGCHDRDNNWNLVVELLPYNKADSVLEHSSTLDTGASSAPAEPSREQSAPRVIGLIGAVRAPEIGYMFNSDYWGKGYATEALRAFMSLFFEHYAGGEYEKFEYAEALTDPELKSSQNVLRKAGFELVERREQDFLNPVLGWRDTLVFRMDRPINTA